MKAPISISNVTKSFGRKTALNNVTLEVQPGQIFGFLGPNGAGKSTTIRCLMDFIRPDTGKVTVLGQPVNQNPSFRRYTGYLSADLQLRQSWTVQTHLSYFGQLKGTGRSAELVKLFNLDTRKKISQLSSGNQQKLAIILAFLGEPKLLIMDEPTRALDPLLQSQLYELLNRFKAEGGTVFLSSHNLPEVQEICDSVAVIKAGKIVASETMQDILKNSTRIVKATARHPFSAADFTSPDIAVVSHADHSIVLKVSGDIDPIVKVLATYHLTELQVTHASLEETFMEYYS